MPGQSPEASKEQAEFNEGLARMYDLTAGKYDITCEAGPSFTTQRQESAAQMTEFVRAFPAAAPIVGDLIAKALDWPGAEEIASRLKALLPPQATGIDPQLQQMQQQMQQMDQQAREAVGQLQQQLQQIQQDKQLEARKIEIDEYKAQTERMKVVNDAQAKAVDARAGLIEAALGQAPQNLAPEQPMQQ
jgi:uncharacterized protein (DUF342 family)